MISQTYGYLKDNIVFGWLSRHILSHGHLRRLLALLWYVLGLFLCYFAAFALRFDGRIDDFHWRFFVTTWPLLLLLRLGTFFYFDLFTGIWRFISLKDVTQIVSAVIFSSSLFSFIYFFYNNGTFSPYPRSVIIIEAMLYILYCVGGRTVLRLVREMGTLDRGGSNRPESVLKEKSLILGDLGCVNSLLSSINGDLSTRQSIVGVLCPQGKFHRGESLQGVKILGSREQIGIIAKECSATNILLVEPYTSPNELKKLTDEFARLEVRVQLLMVPSVSDLVEEKFAVSTIRNVDIEDLLGRKRVSFDNDEVFRFLSGKRVMITGAGGSIGGELARQIRRYHPSSLILFENNEYALYKIHLELIQKKTDDLQLIPYAGDVRFEDDVDNVCRQYQPQIIFHAAAYKHVPLMEENVSAAFRTNILGTNCLVNIACSHRVGKVIFVSSDKAVFPTSVMGATKHLAERIFFEKSKCDTQLMTLRFGNVIGSSGSVVPLFEKQIAAGGPITVTTPNVTRYFMTIREAVDLLLQASAIGNDRDILILEMGEPVKIDDLGRRLIELSGYIPDVDIKVNYIGLRPGEKEFEELLTDDENIVRTQFDKIWVLSKNDATPPPQKIDMNLIQALVRKNDDAALRRIAGEYITDHRLLIKTEV